MEVVAKQLHAQPSLWLNKEKQASCFKRMSSDKVLSLSFTISSSKADWTGIYHIFADLHIHSQNYPHPCSLSAGTDTRPLTQIHRQLSFVWTDWLFLLRDFMLQSKLGLILSSMHIMLLFSQLLTVYEDCCNIKCLSNRLRPMTKGPNLCKACTLQNVL